ncbi:MAG: helix-turn-helix domain-containing protein [Desulfarculus sp.]|nr:helix-turn-helix domain-containing protein [Desulfarculus sp.]
MRCPSCSTEMTCRLGEHQYSESGLRGVYLSDVELWECPCGERAVGIPAVPELHRLLGQELVRKRSLLDGAEIRFLRKNLGLAAKDFADLLGVDKATVSRWENDKQGPDRSTDRLIRLVYGGHKGISLPWLMEQFADIAEQQTPAPPLRVPRSFWSREPGPQESCPR